MKNIAPAPDHAPVRRILVVDDMEANRAVLCRRLERFGYAVESVDSGAAALASIAQALPDMVLLDYMMPQMNGIEMLQILRRDLRTRDLPVIMVTARAESGATIEALGAGADDYVTKPIDFDVLRARIATHMDKRSSAEDLRRANAALDERVVLRSN
ncbi:MAG: response regulator [Novosphingobium sp.]|nr:response regulator [Novosphingobium sp.]